MNRTKQIFTTLFLVLVILLMFLPFITTFNEFLTRVFLKLEWYRAIERLIVPFEVRSIVAVLRVFNMEVFGTNTSIRVNVNGAWQEMWISWNCIGWQSAILLILTLFTGLQGNYKVVSKAETIAIGVLGTFVVNIFRMSLVVIIFKYFGHLPALIFHDYFANIAIIGWLFFFWWFSYSFVLEERRGD